MSPSSLASVLAQLANEAQPESLAALRDALASAQVKLSSPVNTVLRVIKPHTLPPSLVGAFLSAWQNEGTPPLPPAAVALALDSAQNAVATVRRGVPLLELVWTGEAPPIGNYVRPTPAVILEMLENAKHRVLVVGYDLREASERIIDALAKARQRGCVITVALHDNGHNHKMLDTLWPGASHDTSVRVLTWRGDPEDEKASLHAKVLAADDNDVLITSANLTFHGLERNLELGARIKGDFAWEVIHHFASLEEYGILISPQGA